MDAIIHFNIYIHETSRNISRGSILI